MMLHKRTSYFYPLPERLIAQRPCGRRDQARLLIVDRAKGSIRHDIFARLNDHLPGASHLVINNSKVIPARLLGHRSSGGAVEVFLLNSIGNGNLFEVLLRPLKKIREGEKIDFASGISAVVENKEKRMVRFNKKNIFRYLLKIGHMPLPPYIQRPNTPRDAQDYQTVYAKQPGSVAAPTAGLHFTKRLIRKLRHQGHRFLELTLYINYATFKPVQCADIRDHHMPTEYYSIKPSVASVIKTRLPRQTKSEPRNDTCRLVAVGTTSCRVLESVYKDVGAINNRPYKAYTGTTDLFIYPGYQFQMVDALITNFHLPYSSLLMLVCAFGGYDLVMKAYQEAIKERYRFYSYGDAMLII